jgi:hypothetical protein
MNYLFYKTNFESDDIVIIDKFEDKVVKGVKEEVEEEKFEEEKVEEEIGEEKVEEKVEEEKVEEEKIVKEIGEEKVVKEVEKFDFSKLPPIPIRVRKPIRKYNTTFSVSLFSHKIIEIYSNKSVNLGIGVGIGIGFSLGSVLSLFLISQINKNQIN